MAQADDMIRTAARSALAVDAADVRDMIEGAETWRRHHERSGGTEERRYVAFQLLCNLLPSARS